MRQFLSAVITASGLLSYGKTDKGLARRINNDAVLFMGTVAAIEAARREEREACAELIKSWDTAMTDKLAAEIRSRQNKEATEI